MSSTEFWSHWGWPFATSILSFIFSLLLLQQYIKRKQLHQLAWFIGMFFYAIAAMMETYSEYTQDWIPFIYRIYIVLASALVGFLGLGSLYLISRKKTWAHIYLTFNIILFVLFITGTFTTKLIDEKLVAGITVGGEALGATFSYPRILGFFFNIPGSLFLFGAAIYSAFKFSRKQEYAYRFWANVLIAAGTLVIASAGGMARAGRTVGLYPAEMVGAALLLWGFLKAATLRKGRDVIRTKRDEKKAE